MPTTGKKELLATCPRSLQVCSCPVPCLLQTWDPNLVWAQLLRAGAQPAPGEQSATPALTLQSLWSDVGGLQAEVILIPALLSSSTLLIVSCMLWRTCCRWSRVTHPSPPSPSGAQVSHSRTERLEVSISVLSLVSLCTTLGKRPITSVLPKGVTCNP